MKKIALMSAIVFAALAYAPPVAQAGESKWAGVDETVVEKVAEEAGRPAREPFINTDQGDLLLFVFLLAGVAGGFTMGVYYRQLFPSRDEKQQEK